MKMWIPFVYIRKRRNSIILVLHLPIATGQALSSRVKAQARRGIGRGNREITRALTVRATFFVLLFHLKLEI